jgi:hypothetical protein
LISDFQSAAAKLAAALLLLLLCCCSTLSSSAAEMHVVDVAVWLNKIDFALLIIFL